jgi:hypothetical protein
MVLTPGFGECDMAANAFGGRIRTRLGLGSVLPQATDILPACPYPAWSTKFHVSDE